MLSYVFCRFLKLRNNLFLVSDNFIGWFKIIFKINPQFAFWEGLFTCPTEAFTQIPDRDIFFIVLTFAGDSTIISERGITPP